MHCPQCGQEQISPDTKFCSRCGFQLALVAELLANGGFLPQLAELYKGKRGLLTRKNGLIFTTLWFIFFVMMLPAFFGIADADDAAGIIAVFGLFSSLMLFIVSLAALRKGTAAFELQGGFGGRPGAPAPLYGSVNHPELAAPTVPTGGSYIPPETSWRTPDTGELRRPGSVVEGTTKLLKKDDQI